MTSLSRRQTKLNSVAIYLTIYTFLALTAMSNRRAFAYGPVILAGAFLFLFMGFRFETGCDWSGYLHRWNSVDQETRPWSEVFGGELGFSLFQNSMKGLGLDYVSFNAAISLVLVFCYIRFARAHYFHWLILALLFPIVMVQLGMSGVRQALAGGFLLLSFNAFLEGKKSWAAIWVLIATQFHASAVSFLPIAFFAGERITGSRLTLTILGLVPLSALLMGERADQYQARYGAGEVISGGALVRYAISLWIVPVFYVYRQKILVTFPKEFPLLSFSALIIVALSPLVFVSSIALHRLNYYVVPLSVLLCVYVGSVAFKRPIIGHSIALAIYGGYMVFWFLFSRHASFCYVPYENVLLM